MLVGCGGERPQAIVLTIPPDPEARSYTLVDSFSDLPAPVREATVRLCNGCEIADIGESFRRTDVIIDASLPERRLVRAGRSGSRWFVHYEHGGLGYHEHAALFDLRGDSAVFSGGSAFNTDGGVITHVYSTCAVEQSDCEW